MWKKLIFVLLPITAFCQETVYCLHGFMRTPSCMNKMVKALRNEGYEVENWGYPNRERFIQEHAQELVIDLEKTASVYPGEPIHFVTHSMGGLIVRAALNHPDCPEEAKWGRAILMAPPNQGAKFGQFLSRFKPIRKLFGEKAGRQILHCEHFDFLGEFPESKEILIISGTLGFNPTIKGKNDGKLGIHESCLDTPHEHITYPVNHTFIMHSDAVIYNTIAFLLGENLSIAEN